MTPPLLQTRARFRALSAPVLVVLFFTAATATAGPDGGAIAAPQTQFPWFTPGPVVRPQPPARPARTALSQLLETEVFLSKRAHGLPYSPDPRPLTPTSEVIRLLVDAQALGYLNLHALTGERRYLADND